MLKATLEVYFPGMVYTLWTIWKPRGDANKHKEIIGDHEHRLRIDEPDRGAAECSQGILWQHLQQLN